MKKLSLTLSLLFITKLFAQVGIGQSDANIKWLEINSEHFKIVFPDYLAGKAQYTLNLLEHYSPIVSETYNYQPKKLTLVIRPQVNDPNGFVTYAPRRSEWFHHSSLTPLIGSLEWMQALAVHEYRHVAQLDSMNKDNMQVLYYLFGESFYSFFTHFIMPNWYFEGDATWAETVYSDAGRGRSPRFSARLKAQLMSGDVPDYDTLLATDFTTGQVSWYVYGYLLVTRTVNIYGEKVWNEIVNYAVKQPWNVYAFYDSFKKATGKDFDEFYHETMLELQKSWSKEGELTPAKKQKYYREIYPMDYGLSLYRDLNGIWELRRKGKKIRELNIAPSQSRVDVAHKKFLFSSPQPHYRYGYKSYQDLFELDLVSNKLKRLTHNKRYYHPQYSPSGIYILATSFNDKDKFELHLIKNKKVILKIEPKDEASVYAEGVWFANDQLILLKISPDGKKSLVHYYIGSGDEVELTAPTRNNIYSLLYRDEKLYFEADYRGAVNIFSLSLDSFNLSKCTDEPIAAMQPRIIKDKLYYSFESSHGNRIKRKDLNCTEMAYNDLFKDYAHLGTGPSDNYTETDPIEMNNFERFYTATQSTSPYSETDGIFSPHSWNFFGGRGYQIEVNSDNMLGTMSATAIAGITSEENQPFTGLSFSYGKYYPIMNFAIDYLQRKTTLASTEEQSSWSELKSTFSVTLPYIHQYDVYTGIHQLSFYGQHIAVSENDYNSVTRLNDDSLLVKGVNFLSTYTKMMGFRQLQPTSGYDYFLEYADIAQDKTNFYFTHSVTTYFPGLRKVDGLDFKLTQERRSDDPGLYYLNNNYVSLSGYNFSRGYGYEFSKAFDKLSLEYVAPLFYPNWKLSDWIYFQRIYGRAFFDSTIADVYSYTNDFQERTYNSYGAEFSVETNSLRKFPITLGMRFLRTMRDDQNHAELFFGLNIR